MSAQTSTETLGPAALRWPAFDQWPCHLQDLTSLSEPMSPVVPVSSEATNLYCKTDQDSVSPLRRSNVDETGHRAAQLEAGQEL